MTEKKTIVENEILADDTLDALLEVLEELLKNESVAEEIKQRR